MSQRESSQDDATERPRCFALTAKGKPCPNQATRKSGMCGWHDRCGEVLPMVMKSRRLRRQEG